MDEIRRLKREVIARGAITAYCKDTMRLPGGGIAFYDHVEHRGAAAIVPVRRDGRIILVHQYRNSLERETWEIPAGGLNRNPDGTIEDTKPAAIRELWAETGYETEDAELLISIYTTVAFCNEKIDIYLATDLHDPGAQHLDEDEYVEYRDFSLEELKEMIFQCKIQDSNTVAAILAYADRIREGK